MTCTRVVKKSLKLSELKFSGKLFFSESMFYQNPFPADSFKKCNIKNNPNMCILMYFKIQSDQLRITQNALKSQIFDLFTKSSSGYK